LVREKEMTEERAKCPSCGIPTVPNHEDLDYEDMLCDVCYEKEEKFPSKEEWPENYDKPDFLKPDVMAGYQKLKR